LESRQQLGPDLRNRLIITPFMVSKNLLVGSVGDASIDSDFSIGKILQATIGGTVANFRPQWISDRVYKFVVAFKNVGFHIYNLRSFSCDQYKIFFSSVE
jgi:hypothetical protein